MTCDEARARLLDAQRGRLPADRRALLDAHVAGCEACAHEEAAETLLSELLEHRLPQHAAPLALKRRLAATWPDAAAPALPWWAGWRRALVPALADPALFAGFKDLRRMTALMRQPRTAADEPAGTFSILSVTRGL